jgi:DNA polymerase-3 subunit alpha
LKDLKNDIEKFKDREFSVGGMVTSAREGFSKNGKPFSTLTLADYTDSYEFFFFGQDYVNFQKYCKPGLFILVKGAVRQRFRSEFHEFKATQIELLSEVRKKYVKSVTLNMPLNIISDAKIVEIEKLVKNNKGNTLLKFNIYDPESNLNIKLFSRNSKIELTDTMIKYFDDNPDIGYTIN